MFGPIAHAFGAITDFTPGTIEITGTSENEIGGLAFSIGTLYHDFFGFGVVLKVFIGESQVIKVKFLREIVSQFEKRDRGAAFVSGTF